jgi:hypothetical protein
MARLNSFPKALLSGFEIHFQSGVWGLTPPFRRFEIHFPKPARSGFFRFDSLTVFLRLFGGAEIHFPSMFWGGSNAGKITFIACLENWKKYEKRIFHNTATTPHRLIKRFA